MAMLCIRGLYHVSWSAAALLCITGFTFLEIFFIQHKNVPKDHIVDKANRGREKIKMRQFYFPLECVFDEDKDCLTPCLGPSPELVGLVQKVSWKTRWIKVIDRIF